MNTEIGLKERVDAIKVGSSAYNYYMNTPLSELKTREEKLIKQELESRSMTALSEGDTTDDIDDTATTPEDTDEGLSTGQKVAIGTGAAAGTAMVSGAMSKLLTEVAPDAFKAVTNFFTVTISGAFEESIKSINALPGAETTGKIFSTIFAPFKGLWNAFSYSGEWLYDKLLKPIGQSIGNIWGDLQNIAKHIPGMTDLYNFIKSGTDQIVEGFRKVLVDIWGMDANNFSTETLTTAQRYTAKMVFIALSAIAIALIWKVARHFIKDNGETKSGEELESDINSEEEINESLEYNYLTKSLTPITKFGNIFSESYNPVYNNLPLAFFIESDNSNADVTTIITTGDQSITSLLSDPKFIKFMSDKQPELLRIFEDYKNDNKTQLVTESDMPELSNKDNNEVMPVEDNGIVENGSTTSLFDSIINGFKKIGSVTADSLNYVKNKITEFKRKFTDSPHTLIRWIPVTVETALAALAIYYLWNTNRDSLNGWGQTAALGTGAASLAGNAIDNANKAMSDKSEPSETEVEQEAFIINQYINALNVISEAMDDMKKQNVSKINVNKVLDGFNGKSDKMSTQVIDRAKKVSVDLLNQNEFITFSKKYNPEALTILKKASKLK